MPGNPLFCKEKNAVGWQLVFLENTIGVRKAA
jgi:hypothetical protein